LFVLLVSTDLYGVTVIPVVKFTGIRPIIISSDDNIDNGGEEKLSRNPA